MRTERDEYEWDKYTCEYAQQYQKMVLTAGENGSDFLLKNWSATNGLLNFGDKLHSNWKEIYQAVYSVTPSSVFECGCGGMYHLLNVRALMPGVKLGGCDLLKTQIDFGAKQFLVPPDILSGVRILDFSKDGAAQELGIWDFVFSQAVVMHLSTDKALQFIRNMSLIAGKAFVLMEGHRKHDYRAMFEDIGLLESFEMTRPNRFTTDALLLTRKTK